MCGYKPIPEKNINNVRVFLRNKRGMMYQALLVILISK
jgi:hypothetical protein